MLRRVAFVRLYVSEELSASIIRATRVDELGTTFLQEPHGATFQKTAVFEPDIVLISDNRCSYDYRGFVLMSDIF
jgi:hypothetical protein